MPTFGRKPIYTRYERIDAGNVADVLAETYGDYTLQAQQIRHLFDVYRGKQGILYKTKTVRPEINNKIVCNHANEIVSFKVSYLLSEPIMYVQRGNDSVTDAIAQLNEFMFLESKDTKDKEIADHFNIGGVAYRLVLPRSDYEKGGEYAPFCIYTLDPDRTYVVRSGGIGHEVLCGIYLINRRDADNRLREIACVYTDKEYFEIEPRTKNILVHTGHTLGCVPIFEYINNEARLGSFELVETILDAINGLESARLDGTEQAVQHLLMFKNCEIDADGLQKLREMGAVNVKAPQGVDADIKTIVTELVQGDQQIFLDSLYETVLDIAGMPAASTNVSDSSNNGAVFMRSGWWAADARAKDSEKLWRKSETEFLRLVLRICSTIAGTDLRLADVGIKFTRRNYEDILSKSQTLTNMLSAGIHPKYAIEQSGLFYDPAEVYRESEPYMRKWLIDEEPEEPEEPEDAGAGDETA